MTTFLKERKEVRSVFGLYSIPGNDVNVDGAKLSDDSIYDYLVRDKGKDSIQAKIIRSEKSVSAVATPTEFLTLKMNDLVKMVDLLKGETKRTLTRYLNRNMPIKEAREKTRKDLDAKFMQLMKDHEEDFPKSDVSRAIKKLTGN